MLIVLEHVLSLVCEFWIQMTDFALINWGLSLFTPADTLLFTIVVQYVYINNSEHRSKASKIYCLV